VTLKRSLQKHSIRGLHGRTIIALNVQLERSWKHDIQLGSKGLALNRLPVTEIVTSILGNWIAIENKSASCHGVHSEASKTQENRYHGLGRVLTRQKCGRVFGSLPFLNVDEKR
jgi:hypothetical protein